ncbi:MAG: DJ-1/PfpI family protein [Sporolactobacillus sp.]
MGQLQVGILLFNQVEVLDFAGPYEVLSVTKRLDGTSPFSVVTLSEDGLGVQAVGGLKVEPDYSIHTAPRLDILIIPGGFGARTEQINNKPIIQWIAAQAEDVQVLASVCTGGLLLAQAGLLDGRSATTHWASLDQMERQFPNVTVVRGVKFVDQGQVLTSAGISAGINMAFSLVQRFAGNEVARQTAREMEYDIKI